MSVAAGWILTIFFLFLFFVVFFKLIRIVPEQEAWVIEQFGKYLHTLGAGLHLVIPFVQKVAYQHILKEQIIDVHPQICITRDNVQVTVDGILYLRVIDPEKASYGIDDYRFAAAQLAQTTMRSEIGKIELDNTFSERDVINNAVVKSIDQASEPWGIKVTRYEIRDITPTDTVMRAMEQQVRAEREKRAEILKSEGEKTSRINVSKGHRQEAINLSKGEKTRRINESDGRSRAIEIVAQATADGIRDVAQAVNTPKGGEAVSFQLAEQFITRLGQILSRADTSVLPFELASLASGFEILTGRRAGPAGSPSESSPSPDNPPKPPESQNQSEREQPVREQRSPEQPEDPGEFIGYITVQQGGQT
jgi:regulator of protease activity HflC (stomatin/prohibitin superfamily)